MTPRFGRENLGISQQHLSSTFRHRIVVSFLRRPFLTLSPPPIPVNMSETECYRRVVFWEESKKNHAVTAFPDISWTYPTSDCPPQALFITSSLVHSAVDITFVLVSCSTQAYDREQVCPEGYSIVRD